MFNKRHFFRGNLAASATAPTSKFNFGNRAVWSIQELFIEIGIFIPKINFNILTWILHTHPTRPPHFQCWKTEDQLLVRGGRGRRERGGLSVVDSNRLLSGLCWFLFVFWWVVWVSVKILYICFLECEKGKCCVKYPGIVYWNWNFHS